MRTEVSKKTIGSEMTAMSDMMMLKVKVERTMAGSKTEICEKGCKLVVMTEIGDPEPVLLAVVERG